MMSGIWQVWLVHGRDWFRASQCYRVIRYIYFELVYAVRLDNDIYYVCKSC